MHTTLTALLSAAASAPWEDPQPWSWRVLADALGDRCDRREDAVRALRPEGDVLVVECPAGRDWIPLDQVEARCFDALASDPPWMLVLGIRVNGDHRDVLYEIIHPLTGFLYRFPTGGLVLVPGTAARLTIVQEMYRIYEVRVVLDGGTRHVTRRLFTSAAAQDDARRRLLDLFPDAASNQPRNTGDR